MCGENCFVLLAILTVLSLKNLISYMYYSIISTGAIKRTLALLAIFALIFGPFSKVLVAEAVANTGSVWTTTGSCGTPQNINSYAVGQHVFINGSNFSANTQYAWSIKPSAGGANAVAIASGQITTNGSGDFCFDAITLAQINIGGPYKADVNGKNDNFSVVAAPTVSGCTNPLATNYNPAANTDNGSCIMPPVACEAPYTGVQPNCIPPACPTDTTGVFPACVPVPVPSCTDGILNQDETGIDVGGVCAPVPVLCEAPYTGTVPDCVPPACPTDTTGVFPACVPVPPPACPTGYTGVFPACVPPVVICTDDSANNFGQVGTCTYGNNDEEPVGACEFEGHKYDVAGNPLVNWVIGLMKTVTHDETDTTYDLVNDTTDADGYYCLEWDGTTNAPTDLSEPYSFVYRVYEIMKEGWQNNSVEKGTKANNEANELTVVDDSDVLTEAGRTSVQVGETNGYVYADAAYHVDFYNKETENSDQTTDTYKIFGTVWHDTDEDDAIDEGEDDLSGWTVRAVNASTSEAVHTTSTDATGHYEFNVAAGTWIISELTEDGWVLLSDGDSVHGTGTYTVTVPAPVVVTLLDWFIPTAEAATLASFGPYNFGNILATTTTPTTHRHHHSSSNSRTNGQVLGDSTTQAPVGEVLGASTSTLPFGAPNTGAGGTSPVTAVPTIDAILAARLTARKAK